MKRDIIISLFDHSTSWSLFYEKAGYLVIRVDLKSGIDILTWNYKWIDRNRVAGILAAPPCTEYTVSCNRLWADKDRDGRTKAANALIDKTLEIVDYFWHEDLFWAMENPVGRLTRMLAGNYLPGEPTIKIPTRLRSIVKKPVLKFNPCDYGDPWTKQTLLWGKFNRLEKRRVPPIQWADQGSWTQALGGKSERTKEIRSITPSGFARAFFDANNPLGNDIGNHIDFFGRCKFGQWTCEFAVCQEVCDNCEEADNYQPNDYAMEFETEEEYMQDVFNKGAGILLSVDPKHAVDGNSMYNSFPQSAPMKRENPITVYPVSEAKKLFKRCRNRGLIVDLGKATGNIWSSDRKRKLAWLVKDRCDNWIIEKLRPVPVEEQIKALETAKKFLSTKDKTRVEKQIKALTETLNRCA